MYYSFTKENFRAAVEKTLLDNKVDRLVQPKNSEFYYLKELSFDDISFAEQYSYKYTTMVEYKVDVPYNSRSGEKRTGSYSSYSIGARFEESEGVDKIPKKIYEASKPKLNENEVLLENLDDHILRTSKTKIKAKVRRTGDMIEREDMEDAVFVSREEKSSGSPNEYLIWSPLINKNTKKRIGYGVVTHRGVEYFFSPDKTKAGLDKTLKPTPQPKAAPAPAAQKSAAPKPAKKKKPRRSLGDRISSLLAQGILAAIVAAVLLVVEVVLIFAVGLFFDLGAGSIMGKGYILKNSPGLYQINTENYSDYIMVSALENGSERYRLDEGEHCNYIGRTDSASMQDYALFQIIPRSAAISLFDLREKKSLTSVGEYTSSELFNMKSPKYVVTDLTVKLEIVYSYQGTEYTVPVDVYIDEYEDFYGSATVKVDFPDEIMKSHTGEYVVDMKGNTVTRTLYWADVDYWSFRVVEASGIAEVEEVSR